MTPEFSDIRGDTVCLQNNATTIPGIVTQYIADLARRTGCWINLGSMHEKYSETRRLANTSVCFSPDGEIQTQYHKVHLYDAAVNGYMYKESDEFCHGDSLQTVKIDSVTLGLSICYDLRFVELYRALRAKGADVLVVSAAFNAHTGRDHWQVLLQARAIENQCYVMAVAQIGGTGSQFPCLGRSMVIDPWGVVLSCMPDQTGYICVDLDPACIAAVREKMPVWEHRRNDLYPTYF